MRDLYTIASGSTRVPLYFPADTYATQIATVEDFDDDKRIALCSELIDAYKLLNGATLRPTIDGRRMSFATRKDAMKAITAARGGFSDACAEFFNRFVTVDE